jgi:hypothetical protein
MINGHPVSLPLFLVIFAAGWLAMTVLLDAMSGWPGLQRRYPEIKEDQLPIRGFNAVWGGALSRRGSLMVSAGRSGLRVKTLKIFAPFARPITVPWNEISAQRLGHGRRAQIAFGTTGACVTVDAEAWEALASRVPNLPSYSS